MSHFFAPFLSFRGNPLRVYRGLFALLSLLLVGIFPAQAKDHPVPVAEPVRFAVTVTGSGPDVLLIPGLGSSSKVWDATVARFKGSYRLHTVNVAGFAGVAAAANANGAVIEPTVAALRRYIVKNKLQSSVIVGHSIGGLMALELARSAPKDVRKIIIVDALPYAGLMFSPQASVAAMQPQAVQMREQMKALPDAAFASQQGMGVVRLVSAPAQQAIVAGWTVASDRAVFAQALYDAMTIDVRPMLGAIKTPATLFYALDTNAGQDETQTEALYRNAYQPLTQLKFKRFDNSRHFIMLDQPDAFFKALKAELAD